MKIKSALIQKILIFSFCLFLLVIPRSVYSSKFSSLVLTSSNIDKFEKLLKTEKEGSCVIVQVKPGQFDESKASILMDWVSRGGVLWFYDSGLAHYFGMEEASFEARDFPFKKVKGEYGGDKNQQGIAAGCEAWGNHGITIGIRRVMVFILEIGDGKFSAVKDENIMPLLKINRNDSYCVSAIKNIGQGSVIFKPLLWEDQFDGRDFQRKLIKYSSGDAVPFFK